MLFNSFFSFRCRFSCNRPDCPWTHYHPAQTRLMSWAIQACFLCRRSFPRMWLHILNRAFEGHRLAGFHLRRMIRFHQSYRICLVSVRSGPLLQGLTVPNPLVAFRRVHWFYRCLFQLRFRWLFRISPPFFCGTSSSEIAEDRYLL